MIVASEAAARGRGRPARGRPARGAAVAGGELRGALQHATWRGENQLAPEPGGSTLKVLKYKCKYFPLPKYLQIHSILINSDLIPTNPCDLDI